jgi:transposase
MSPNHSQTSQNKVEQEGRLLLAIQAFKNKEIPSIREAARRFNVPKSTLTTRLRGVQNRTTSRANSHKLTEVEEETLQKWILSLDDRRAAPRPTTVRETANLLLEARGTTPVQTVEEKWVYNFVKRHPELLRRFLRHYNMNVRSVKTRKSSVNDLISFKNP